MISEEANGASGVHPAETYWRALKCSSLQKSDGSYAPAYMLADNRMERTGRVTAGTPKVHSSHLRLNTWARPMLRFCKLSTSKRARALSLFSIIWIDFVFMQANDRPAFTSSAILIIIGDEILSGKVADQNAQFLCQELFLLGWRVIKARSQIWLCQRDFMRALSFAKQWPCSYIVMWVYDEKCTLLGRLHLSSSAMGRKHSWRCLRCSGQLKETQLPLHYVCTIHPQFDELISR